MRQPKQPVRYTLQDEWDGLEGRAVWLVQWARQVLYAMGRVAPDAPRFETLEDEWEAFEAREADWLRTIAEKAEKAKEDESE